MFQRGLELLEQQLQKEMDKHSTEYKGVVDHGGGYYLYQTVSCRPQNVENEMKRMFPEISIFMEENSIEASGKPFTLNHKLDSLNNSLLFSACFPIKERIETEGKVLTGYLHPQKTFKTIYKGNYKYLAELWPKIHEKLRQDGHKELEKGYSFEVYTISPQQSENPAEWLTEIYIPIE